MCGEGVWNETEETQVPHPPSPRGSSTPGTWTAAVRTAIKSRLCRSKCGGKGRHRTTVPLRHLTDTARSLPRVSTDVGSGGRVARAPRDRGHDPCTPCLHRPCTRHSEQLLPTTVVVAPTRVPGSLGPVGPECPSERLPRHSQTLSRFSPHTLKTSADTTQRNPCLQLFPVLSRGRRSRGGTRRKEEV